MDILSIDNSTVGDIVQMRGGIGYPCCRKDSPTCAAILLAKRFHNRSTQFGIFLERFHSNGVDMEIRSDLDEKIELPIHDTNTPGSVLRYLYDSFPISACFPRRKSSFSIEMLADLLKQFFGENRRKRIVLGRRETVHWLVDRVPQCKED